MGYRVPTDTELDTERVSWSSNDAAGAFASALKMPLSGYRLLHNGSLSNVGTRGRYWSSVAVGTVPWYLYFDAAGAYMSIDGRAGGFGVRCLKD